MNPVSEGIKYIFNNIPREILRHAFADKNNRLSRYIDTNKTEDLVRNFIYNNILPDCNMSGGISINIDLSGIGPKGGGDELIYIIPPDLTDGKRIVSATSVNINPPNVFGSMGGSGGFKASRTAGYNNRSEPYCQNSSSPVMRLAEQSSEMALGRSNIPHFTNTNVEIVGNNSIRVKNFPQGMIYRSLSCFLEYGEDMNEIDARSIPDFRRLCLYGAERYIYNELVISIDEDQIRLGAQLGSFKRIVEDYKDSAKDYDDWLRETMGVVLFINDGERYDEYLDSMMQPIF